MQRNTSQMPIAILGGGAVSVFYNQLKKSLPKGTIISLGKENY